MATANEAAVSSVRCRLSKERRICKEVAQAAPTSVVNVTKLVCVTVAARLEYAALAQLSTNVHGTLEESRTAGYTMSQTLEAEDGQMPALKGQLADVWAALEKLVGKPAQTETHLPA